MRLRLRSGLGGGRGRWLVLCLFTVLAVASTLIAPAPAHAQGDEATFGDVNCDARRDIVDALVIAQYVVGNRSESAGCPLADPAAQIDVSLADINSDGEINIVDALELARCAARIDGSWCGPEPVWVMTDQEALTWPREIVDLDDGSILVATASHVERIAADGSRSQFGDFVHGNGLHLTDDGEVWVTDSRGFRVHVFDLAGNELRTIGTGVEGTGPGEFGCANSIHVDGGEVFVLDGDQERLQVFDLAGNYLREWGSTGSGPGQFDIECGTSALTIFDDEIFVSDCRNQRVQVFARDGSYLREWGVVFDGSEQFEQSTFCPSGITADAAGTIYLAYEFAAIVALTSTGQFIETIWSAIDDYKYGQGPRLDELYGLHVNAAGTRVWVSNNARPQRVVTFDRAPDPG